MLSKHRHRVNAKLLQNNIFVPIGSRCKPAMWPSSHYQSYDHNPIIELRNIPWEVIEAYRKSDVAPAAADGRLVAAIIAEVPEIPQVILQLQAERSCCRYILYDLQQN